MTPNQLPPLSDEQFPDFLTDTDVARIFRHVYGGQQFDSTERMFSAEVEAAVRAKFREALAAIAQQAQEPVHQFRRQLCADWYDGHPDHEDGGGPYETRILYTAQQAQPVDELPDLNPEDFVVDVVFKQLGGFAPVTTHGVRVTHKPSRVSVVVDSERSQHQNRQLALEALRAIIRPQDHPVPAPSPQAPGRRKGPPGITLEPHGHEPPAVPGVSDEQIRKTVESIQDPDTVPAFHNGYYTLTPDELRRAILALRPAVEPMTPEQMRAILTEAGYDDANVQARADFINGARYGERHHGITAKAEDAHQPTKEAEKAP